MRAYYGEKDKNGNLKYLRAIGMTTAELAAEMLGAEKANQSYYIVCEKEIYIWYPDNGWESTNKFATFVEPAIIHSTWMAQGHWGNVHEGI